MPDSQTHGSIKKLFHWLPGVVGLLVCPIALACPPAPDAALKKIQFDLAAISSEGLIGSGSGRRSQRYEFCIPKDDRAVAEVRAIDPTIELYPNSRGRVGCRQDQILAIGETHQPRWKEILLAIARLESVDRILPWFGE